MVKRNLPGIINWWAGNPTSGQIATAFASRVAADGGTTEAQACLEARITALKNVNAWNNASVVWMAHGRKANKLYAIKGGPFGDLAFTRASTRTRKGLSLIENVLSGVPAFDYGISTCPALSLEKASTNLLLQSETFDSASWVKVNSTVTANTTPAPDNLSVADTLFETTAVGIHYTNQTITKAASALQYTFSCSVKPNGRSWVVLECYNGANGAGKYFNVSTGAVGSNLIEGTGWTLNDSSITLMPNGYYRCSITVTTDITTSVIGIIETATADLTNNFTGVATNGLYLYGAQLELGSYATSYIPTTTLAVARVTDAITPLLAATSIIGQTEGTIYFEGNAIADSVDKAFSISDGTSNNRVTLDFTSTNILRTRVSTAAIAQATINGPAFTSNIDIKMAVTYKENKISLHVAGAKVGEDLVATIPTCSRIGFNSGSSSFPLLANMKCLALYMTAMSDAAANALTT